VGFYLHRRTCVGSGSVTHLMKFRAQTVSLVAALLAVLPNFWGTRAHTILAAQQGEDSKSHAAQAQIPVALPKGKKLILADGTFQMAREYTVEGERGALLERRALSVGRNSHKSGGLGCHAQGRSATVYSGRGTESENSCVPDGPAYKEIDVDRSLERAERAAQRHS